MLQQLLVFLLAATGGMPSTVQLVPDQEMVMPSEDFWVGVRFELDDGWHMYWKNPGDAGMAPDLRWTLPKGMRVAEVKWPTPEKFEEDEMVGFGYAKPATLLARIVSDRPLTEEFDVEVHARWVVCKDSCVPVEQAHRLTLRVGEDGKPGLLSAERSALPQPGQAKAKVRGDKFMLDVRGGNEAYFFPEVDGVIDTNAPQQLTSGGLALPAQTKSVDALRGVLVVDGQAMEIAAPIAKSTGFAWALLLAFAGGLILNLMPCVLPVISLKILGFVELAGSDRKKIFRHGLEFTAGVLVSFWALTAVLLIMRAIGHGVGWGFQLQEPIFVISLAMLLFLFGLSLFGVFEFGTKLSAVGGKTRGKTFLSGVLATLIATPCTGPFLASALGYAMTLPTTLALVVFTTMAVGMAAPYLLLSAFPSLLRFLPKPGPWMVVFKQAMGFVLMATVLWLLWVFAAQVDAIGTVLLALLVLSLAAWIFGRWATPIQKPLKRRVASLVAGLFLLGGVAMGVQAARTPPSEIEHVLSGRWVSWDGDAFAQARSEKKPIFVDFTAKWCLICQTNKAALHSSSVQAKFDELGVVAMEADWTRRDPRITAELEKFERNGVPLYVYYPAEGEPVVLPQVLTSDAILKAIGS